MGAESRTHSHSFDVDFYAPKLRKIGCQPFFINSWIRCAFCPAAFLVGFVYHSHSYPHFTFTSQSSVYMYIFEGCTRTNIDEKFYISVNSPIKVIYMSGSTYIRLKIGRHKFGGDFVSETMANPTNDAFRNSILFFFVETKIQYSFRRNLFLIIIFLWI